MLRYLISESNETNSNSVDKEDNIIQEIKITNNIDKGINKYTHHSLFKTNKETSKCPT